MNSFLRCFSTAASTRLPRLRRSLNVNIGKSLAPADEVEVKYDTQVQHNSVPNDTPAQRKEKKVEHVLWTPPKPKELPQDSNQSEDQTEEEGTGIQLSSQKPPQKSGGTAVSSREDASEEPVFKTYRDDYTLRWETVPPTPQQLGSTDNFFIRYPAEFLWSAEKFKNMEFGNVPEVVFLGRSNVGKSTLLNSLLNHRNLAITSSKPGRTRLMNAFSVNRNSLVILDMPGYGHASRPEWGTQIFKYLSKRKQFRRAFLLVDSQHGAKPGDLMLMAYLSQVGISYQVVLSKMDKLKNQKERDKAMDKVKRLLTDKKQKRGTSALGEIIGTAALPAKKGVQKAGMQQLRWAVMVAGGLDGSMSLS